MFDLIPDIWNFHGGQLGEWPLYVDSRAAASAFPAVPPMIERSICASPSPKPNISGAPVQRSQALMGAEQAGPFASEEAGLRFPAGAPHNVVCGRADVFIFTASRVWRRVSKFAARQLVRVESLVALARASC
jgi:hypothetical protein